jgi:hypothetical protein
LEDDATLLVLAPTQAPPAGLTQNV